MCIRDRFCMAPPRLVYCLVTSGLAEAGCCVCIHPAMLGLLPAFLLCPLPTRRRSRYGARLAHRTLQYGNAQNHLLKLEMPWPHDTPGGHPRAGQHRRGGFGYADPVGLKIEQAPERREVDDHTPDHVRRNGESAPRCDGSVSAGWVVGSFEFPQA